MSKKDDKIKEVLLNILILFLYFIWPYLSNIVISNDNIIVSFISNMIISIIIIIFFRKKLKKDILKFNKQLLLVKIINNI